MFIRGGRALALGLTLIGTSVAAAEPTLRIVKQGQQGSAQKPSRHVVRTQAEWTALWKANLGGAAPPKVDFSREMVLAAFMGTRPTGGYAIKITSAREEKGKLVVTVTEQQPPPGSMAIQVLTSPFHIVAVKRSSLPIAWKVAAK